MDIILNYVVKNSSYNSFYNSDGGSISFENFCLSRNGREKSAYKTYKLWKKLLKYIMNPSFILTFITGLILVVKPSNIKKSGSYINFLVFCMLVFHMYCGKVRKDFEEKKHKTSQHFHRTVNEKHCVFFYIYCLNCSI